MRKRFLKKCGKILSTALVLVLVVSLLPYARQLLGRFLPSFKEDTSVTLERLSHEMAEVGKLTTVQYTDDGMIDSVTSALLVGNVQRVRIPYRYEIGLGVNLNQITLTAGEDGVITAAVPSVSMMYDGLTVTGEAQIDDFWYPLSEEKYQQIIDSQALACREAYLSDAALLEKAWQSTAAALYGAFVQWMPEAEDFRFVPAEEENSPARGELLP